MGKNKRQNLAHLDTTNIHGASDEGQGSVVSGLGDMGDHIEKLKHVASTMQKLANLLGDQLQGLSGTIPVLHGLGIVQGFRERSKECREGIQVAFEPLRTHIEREKELFYAKNAEAIEKMIRGRVEDGIKSRLPIVLKQKLERYEEYLKADNSITDKSKITQVLLTTSARAANSLLSPKYTDEQVVLIPPHPDWNNLTLGYLKNIGGPAVINLALLQGLTPAEDLPDSELSRVHNLNIILRHLGVQYQAIPSWNGILLTPVSRKTHL